MSEFEAGDNFYRINFKLNHHYVDKILLDGRLLTFPTDTEENRMGQFKTRNDAIGAMIKHLESIKDV